MKKAGSLFILLSLISCSVILDYCSSPGRREVYWVKDADMENIKLGMKSEEIIKIIGQPLAKYHWGEKADEVVFLYQTGSIIFPQKLYLDFGSNDCLRKIEIVAK